MDPREMAEIALAFPELCPGRKDSQTICRSKDLVEVLSAGPCWGLWDRECMAKMLTKDDLLDLCFRITHFGEPKYAAAAAARDHDNQQDAARQASESTATKNGSSSSSSCSPGNMHRHPMT